MKAKKKKFFNGQLLFYCGVLALPILQFCIFYLYVNFNSFVLAVTEYDMLTGEKTFVGLQNFRDCWDLFFGDENRVGMWIRLKNSLVAYGCTLLVGTGGALLFSYYIYKKQAMSGLFKVILFLPSVVPGVVLSSIYKIVMETGVLNLYNAVAAEQITSIINDVDKTFSVVLFYGLFMGFGTQVLMYLGAMNKINPSITEAATLDGVSFIREFFSITLPCIYSTVATFVVVGLTGIFTSELGLYNFFATNAPGNAQTLGYYLYRETQTNATNQAKWPLISTIGLVFTVIVAPITIGLKFFMDSKDPIHA